MKIDQSIVAAAEARGRLEQARWQLLVTEAAQALAEKEAITQAEQKVQTRPFNNDPLRLFFGSAAAILVLIDGQPALRTVVGTDLLRVINTRALLLFDQPTGQYYLSITGRWVKENEVNHEPFLE